MRLEDWGGGRRHAGACKGCEDIPASGGWLSGNCGKGALRVVCVLQKSERFGGGDLGGSSALVGGCRISTARVDGEFRSKGW